MMKWNEQLKQARQSHRWTQTKLAEKVGTTKHTIIRWENGHAFPRSYYRERLTTLFGINFEARDLFADIDHITPEHVLLPSDAEPVLHRHNGHQPLLTPAQPQLATPLAQNCQAYEQQRPWAADHLVPLDIHPPRKRLSTSRPFDRFSRHPVLIGSILLVTALLISTILSQAFIGLTSHTNSPAAVSSGPPIYSLQIQNTDPSLNAAVSHLQKAFQAVYPQLVNRFALDPASAARRTVTLAVAPDLSSPATTNSTTITISGKWIREHPTDIGLLTHELTLL